MIVGPFNLRQFKFNLRQFNFNLRQFLKFETIQYIFQYTNLYFKQVAVQYAGTIGSASFLVPYSTLYLPGIRELRLHTMYTGHLVSGFYRFPFGEDTVTTVGRHVDSDAPCWKSYFTNDKQQYVTK